jgi:apolipoprotein N-acyltransferase
VIERWESVRSDGKLSLNRWAIKDDVGHPGAVSDDRRIARYSDIKRRLGEDMKRDSVERLGSGLVGALLLFFVGWHWHVAIAVWVAAILLVRSFRMTKTWYGAVPVLGATVLFRYLSIMGGWDMPLTMEVAFSLLVLLPLWAALYADRWVARSGRPLGKLLVFPLVYTAGDFLLGFSPVGTVFSPAVGQFGYAALAQTVSLTGLWGLTFLIGVTATTANHTWEAGFDLRKSGRPLAVLAVAFALLLAYGYGKTLLTHPSDGTVRVAGVTETHVSDYWAITDNGTPRESKAEYAPELMAMQDRLFAQSQRAADYGAQIILWTEGNAVMYEDDVDAFLERSRTFARENGVYCAFTPLVLRYGRMKNDNLVYLFGPDGETLFRYEKTISWYPTDSDGVIPSAETPWGTLSAVICFDLDFPQFVRQAHEQDVDILLVPGYDTEHISPFHTQIGRLRGVEYGFSVFRQANRSTSIATDYNGNVLASQDYFDTSDRVMIADVPVKGIWTVYGAVGDWFIVLVWAGLAAVVVLTVRDRARSRKA